MAEQILVDKEAANAQIEQLTNLLVTLVDVSPKNWFEKYAEAETRLEVLHALGILSGSNYCDMLIQATAALSIKQ